MISSNAKYWIWLTLALGYNTPKAKRIAKLYSDISLFYHGGKKEWRFCGILSDSDIEKLSKATLEGAQKIIDRCKELNYSVLAIDDESYPLCLFNIDAPPAVIYISGTLPDIDNRLSIGVVGTRRATDYGLNEYASKIITGIVLFFILGSEFFINYRMKFRHHKKEEV